MTSTPPTRSRAGRLADLVAGIVIAVLAALFAFAMLAAVLQLTALGDPDEKCGGVAVDGLRCSPTFLSTMIVIGVVVVVFGWLLSTGFMIVRLIRKRLAWWVPLISVPVSIAAYYLIVIVLGSSYLPVG